MTSITQKISFGVMASFAVLAALVLPFTSFAAVSTWQATAPAPVVFSCLGNGSIFPHTITTITQTTGGALTGTGWYDTDHSYTWNLTGSVSGNNVSFVITYTGTQAGSVYNLNGTIAPDGSVSGTADSYCQSFTMPAGSLIHPADDEHGSHHEKHECKKRDGEDSHFRNQEKGERHTENERGSRN
jgi:hypothetical protein